MKKWKIVKFVTLIVVIIFIIYLVFDAIACMNMNYPHSMLGIDANTWLDQFVVDLAVIFATFGIPLIIDTVLFIIAMRKIKKFKNN